jgi:glycosyltransferase involved in cell wall biosynthesis
MSEVSPRYAFVLPRFGKGIVGGAEHLVGSLAKRLRTTGCRVEVLTTCARDNRTWQNEFEPGQSVEEGVVVRRFLVDSRDLEQWIPLQIKISEGMKLPLQQQLDWMSHSVNSSALYKYIAEHTADFDTFFFAPYLFGTTFWGALIAPHKSVLIPCLHDEHYAYTEVIRALFREVQCALFNCPPEQELAEQLYGPLRGGSVGMGFDAPPIDTLVDIVPFFRDDFPYMVYLGRKETGKGVPELIDLFIAMKDAHPAMDELKLVIAGGGSFSDLHRPHALDRQDIIDLAPLCEDEKISLLRHATALVQPSRNESFSIVMMESWLVETPVLVHALCPVTQYHTVSASGGLYYANYHEFCETVAELLDNHSLRRSLGRSGRLYVEKEYNWDIVIERFHKAVNAISTSRMKAA